MTAISDSSHHLLLEDAPLHTLPLLQSIHARFGVGDGVVTPRMVERFLRAAAADADAENALLSAVGEIPEDGSQLLQRLRREAAAPSSSDPNTSPLLDPAALAAALGESTYVESGPPPMAPGHLDAEGRLYTDDGRGPLAPGSADLAQALEAMALAMEEGAGWPHGAQDVEGRERLLSLLEMSVAQGMAQDRPDGVPVLEAMRLRVSAMSLALLMGQRDPDETLRARAAAMPAHLLVGEPRRGVRAALAAGLLPLADLPDDVGSLLLEATHELMPKAPPYAQWEASRGAGEPLWVRHIVYAPEYRQVKDGYEAAGFVRVSERPLQLAREVPGGRSIRVELRRAPAAVVINEDQNPEEVLLLSGLASVVELVPSLQPRVVVAAFRRDPFGVPRIADRFPQDHIIGCARGDKPMDDVGFFVALLQSMARREPYALAKMKTREVAPLLAHRALWPHEPGALRAAGGAPAPFASDPSALVEHRLTWAIPRPARRPTDLRWRNDAPDTTSYLALEVATSLAGASLNHEELPVLEPGGFHEGLPDVEVSAGAALWRVTITRGLCAQAEEALTALVTLHSHARRAQLLGDKPRMSLLKGALRAAQITSLQSATQEQASSVLHGVIKHATLPGSLTMEHLLRAAQDPESLRTLLSAHARWLEG